VLNLLNCSGADSPSTQSSTFLCAEEFTHVQSIKSDINT